MHTLSSAIGARRHRLYQRQIEGERVPNSRKTISPVLSIALGPEFIEKPIKGRAPNSRKTHFPVPAGAVYTDFIKKPIRGARVTNSRKTHTLASTSERRRSRPYQKANKGETVPKSRQTHLPVLAGALGPEFIERPRKRARVPNSKKTHLPVLAAPVVPGFIGKPIKCAGGAYRTRGKHTHLPVLSGAVDADFTENQ